MRFLRAWKRAGRWQLTRSPGNRTKPNVCVFRVERNGIVLAVPDILLITGERSVLTRDQVFVYPRRLPGSGIANKSYDMIYFV
jgi:hypothetical protein